MHLLLFTQIFFYCYECVSFVFTLNVSSSFEAILYIYSWIKLYNISSCNHSCQRATLIISYPTVFLSLVSELSKT